VTLRVKLAPSLSALAAPGIEKLVRQTFIASLQNQDPTLWGLEATAEASIRMGWTVAPEHWLPLAQRIQVLFDDYNRRGMRRVVLCGMGGSSLGPEVMCAPAKLPLTVVDSTHPDALAPELDGDLSDAVIVISSKSGSTVETDSHRRAFEGALAQQGLTASEHILVVTDPGSPLSEVAEAAHYPVCEGDPHIGGRFSALSPFGLVPSGLAGLDLENFLHEASQAHRECGEDIATNPALVLGVALACRHPQVNKVLYAGDKALPGFGDWVEQLLAESTGKDAKGLLPVVGSSLADIPDGLSVGPIGSGSEIEVAGSLPEQMVLWQRATAAACVLLGVNPFDQPNVESAKAAAREVLRSPSIVSPETTELDGFQFSTSPDLTPPRSLRELVGLLRAQAGERSYLGLGVFAPRAETELWQAMARSLEQKLGRPVTIGFGPRFLHSTGQFHKGGPSEGVFLQLIQDPTRVCEIPGQEFDFWKLCEAQAHGDARVLGETGVPVMSLLGPATDLVRLREALSA